MNEEAPGVAAEPTLLSCEVCCALTLDTCVEHHLAWHRTLTNQPEEHTHDGN